MKRLVLLTLLSATSTSCLAEQHPGAEEFAKKAAAEYQLDEQQVLAILAQAEFKQSIVDAMTRPAEAKPWFEYRRIFLTDKRINGGVQFWRENQADITQAAEQFQVDPQVIVAIIGVETLYGAITGNYRVLDALATLAFHYPATLRDRSDFFSSELMNFIVLSQEEGIPVDEVTGSYAGAMGLGQFMPSSYREYAVDLNGDERRDLWSSVDDAIGSVANYLHRHGWAYREPVVLPLSLKQGARLELVADGDYKPHKTMGEMTAGGFISATPVDAAKLVTVIRLQEENSAAYWLGFNNFYVITRYNRSPLYAMAVYELSEEIRREMTE
ncbi:MAG: lytic murein transglycosylase B [Xanthomonadales bacterium]|nr:lytic murein transglycosylase B [Xanthomonadales bacterium]